ncbi:MAG: ABC transporter substrate-binding protein, partial [Candidatus Izemoplasmatales bacterium]|nr:ABC transporter substrate-binding protein [Candidatus Izemoplasmatales bacterium]
TRNPGVDNGATGYFNFKYADAATKLGILAAAEKFLLDTYVSIPLFNNSGATVFSDRVDLFSDVFVPVMGYGTLYSTLTTPDGGVGNVYTYRVAATAAPGTLNHLAYASAPESDVLSLALGSLYGFYWNDTKDGYVLKGNWVTQTQQLNPEADPTSGVLLATKYQIQFRQGLKFRDKTGEVLPTTGPNNDITAADFLFTYEQLLDGNYAFRRFNTIGAGTAVLVGADAFRKAKGTLSFDTVGVKAVDGDAYSLSFEFVNKLSEWDFMYYMSSFILTPVYKPMFLDAQQINPTTGAKTSSYGSNELKFASTGDWVLKNWELDKVVEFDKLATGHNASLYQFTNYRITKVADANAALLLFEAGDLDVVGIPSTDFDRYANHPNLKMSPGATVFRIGMNTMSQAQYDDLVAQGLLLDGWQIKPILQIAEFREAVYYAINRQRIAVTIGKTLTPDQTYFTRAYVFDPISGAAYRDSALAQAVIANRNPETFGFNLAKARTLYEIALDILILNGDIPATGNHTISLEYATFTGATHLNYGNELKLQLETAFNNLPGYERITFTLTINQVSSSGGMGVYYDKQMVGRFDLALSGISGSTLDPWSYLDVFSSDDRGGLFLLWGLDTTQPVIDWNGKLWSYDAIAMMATEGVYVIRGVEVSQEVYEAEFPA